MEFFGFLQIDISPLQFNINAVWFADKTQKSELNIKIFKTIEIIAYSDKNPSILLWKDGAWPLCPLMFFADIRTCKSILPTKMSTDQKLFNLSLTNRFDYVQSVLKN